MILFKIAEFCSKLPFSKIYVATPDFWVVLAYYAVIAMIVLLFQRKKIQFLRFILGNGTSRFIKKHWQKLVASVTISVILLEMIQIVPRNLHIYFVDVGQRRLLCDSKSDWKKYNY